MVLFVLLNRRLLAHGRDPDIIISGMKINVLIFNPLKRLPFKV